MKDKIKNILNLTKLFIKEDENNLKLFNKKKEFNKKSIIFWAYLIIFCGIFYLSSEIMYDLKNIGANEIFLNGFLLFLEILIIIRTIMVSMNIFYFSKDIENILYLPFKPLEILISKFFSILFINYEIELIFGLIPLLVYGFYLNMQFLYFINLILILIIFPVFTVLIVSIIMMALMKTIKLFKNKDLMQIIISFILIFVLIFFINKSSQYIFTNLQNIDNKQIAINNINEKIIKINNYFCTINPSAKILEQNNFLKIVINYIKISFINLIAFLLFIILGNKLYLQQLLKAKFYFKNKRNKKINLNKNIKKNNIRNSYIKKEFKLLLKNPLFFIQSIYPVFLLTIVINFLLIVLIPQYQQILAGDEYKHILKNLKFDFESVCIITGILQIIGLLNYTSITAISREGKDSYIMKILPINLYKQFIYKNIPQIFINTICSSITLIIIKLQIPVIKNKYIFSIFIISFLMTIINSFILVLIDLLLPKIKWDSEYEILKNNKNKLLQYVLIILNILFLIYINKILKNYNLNISLNVFMGFLIFIFIIFNILINKYKNKIFKKIN